MGQIGSKSIRVKEVFKECRIRSLDIDRRDLHEIGIPKFYKMMIKSIVVTTGDA